MQSGLLLQGKKKFGFIGLTGSTGGCKESWLAGCSTMLVVKLAHNNSFSLNKHTGAYMPV